MNKIAGIKQVISEVVSLLFKSDEKRTIDQALQLLLDFFELDWVYVTILEPGQRSAHFLYEMTSDHVTGRKDVDPFLPYDTIPWMINKLLSGEDIILDNIENLPAEASVDGMLFKEQGLQSLLIIPLTFKGTVGGFMGFDSIRTQRHWSHLEVEDLHIIANIFSVIIERQCNQLLAREEKRRSELALQKAREADILKSAFIASMSHEIRTPLNAIVGFSSIIAETEEIEERRHYQKVVEKNNDMLLQIISDILDFSQIESGELPYEYMDFNLREICHEINYKYTSRSQSGVPFFFHRERHPDIVLYTDGNRIKQVITNLVMNAYKFTTEGSIVLSYRIVDNDYVRISVSDTGIGIPPEHHDDIFERFVKVDSFSQGTGLGLPICKTIVETLHGQMGLNSLPGKGSTFWFTLPLKPR